MDVNIREPKATQDRDAEVRRLIPILASLTEAGMRGVLGNVVMAALTHPEEVTSRALIQQIVNHARYEAEHAPAGVPA